jgi:hypothetical protein
LFLSAIVVADKNSTRKLRSAAVAQLQFQKDDAVTVRSWGKALSAVKMELNFKTHTIQKQNAV